MTTTIKLRRDTSSNWANANPILALGEPGLDTTTNQIKYGDGSTVWANLPYAGSSIGNLEVTGTTIGIAPGATETVVALGGTAANVIVDTNTGAPKINIFAQSTDFQSYSQGDSDYTSAEWVTDGGGGAINITGAQSYVETFVSTLNQYSLVTITINSTDTVPYNGVSYGGGSITLYTNTAPATSPTVVNSIGFNLTFKNGLLLDPDEGDMLFRIGDFNLNMSSQRDINITSDDDLRLLGNDITRLAGNANVTIVSNFSTDPNYTWTFDSTGNLILPVNTFAVNYANGTQVPLGGGGNTGNVTFNDQVVQGTGDESGGGGLYLAPGTNSTANLQYLRVRGGDYPTHIHLDTGNNQYYDQYFGADSKYVKLEANGNIVINADDYGGNSGTWSFTTDGNLILANGNSVIKSIANSSLDPLNPNVSTMTLTPDANYSQQALVLDPTAPGHIHLRSPGSNIDQPSANLFLGGEASSFEVGQSYGAAPNLFIHSNNNTWTFDIDGNLTLPQLTTISDESGIGTTLTVGVPPTVIVISGADFSAVNTTYTKTSATTPTWEPAGYNPATDPYIQFTGGQYGIFAPSFGQAIYVNAGTLNKPLTQWSVNPPLGSIAPAALYTYGTPGPDWVFGNDGLLTLPGGNVTIGNLFGGYAIVANNGPFGVVSQGNSSGSVLQWIDDISNTNALSAIYVNSPTGNIGDIQFQTGDIMTPNVWIFSNDGTLTIPGNLIANGASPAPTLSGFSSVSALQFTNGNSNVTINANSNLWAFDSTGNLKLPGNTFAVNYANGTQASAPLVDILNTNGQTTVYYPTFVEDRTDGQIVRADVDLSYRTDTNTLTVGNVTAINLINTVTVYANLPAATTAGIRAFISDANLVATGNFGATVGSGGSNTVPVYSDGTNWRIG